MCVFPRCTKLPSSGSGSVTSTQYLFIQASVECRPGGWQAPLWLLMLILLAFPGLLVWFLRYAVNEVRAWTMDEGSHWAATFSHPPDHRFHAPCCAVSHVHGGPSSCSPSRAYYQVDA